MSINIPTAFRSQISIPYGDLEKVLNWCKKNCTGEFKFQDDLFGDISIPFGNNKLEYSFFFENERDYIAFQVFVQ